MSSLIFSEKLKHFQMLSAAVVIGALWVHNYKASDFICVEVLRPSQPNGVMSSVVSLPNHTFTRHALSSKRLTSIVHILSPEKGFR